MERTRQTLTDKGVDYVSQAKYVVNIASEVVGFDETSGVTYGDIKSRDDFDALSKVEIRAYAKKYDTGQKGTAVAALNYHYNYLLKNGSRAADRYFEY